MTLSESDRDYLAARIRNLGRIRYNAIVAGDVYAEDGVRYTLDALCDEMAEVRRA